MYLFLLTESLSKSHTEYDYYLSLMSKTYYDGISGYKNEVRSSVVRIHFLVTRTLITWVQGDGSESKWDTQEPVKDDEETRCRWNRVFLTVYPSII